MFLLWFLYMLYYFCFVIDIVYLVFIDKDVLINIELFKISFFGKFKNLLSMFWIGLDIFFCGKICVIVFKVVYWWYFIFILILVVRK